MRISNYIVWTILSSKFKQLTIIKRHRTYLGESIFCTFKTKKEKKRFINFHWRYFADTEYELVDSCTCFKCTHKKPKLGPQELICRVDYRWPFDCRSNDSGAMWLSQKKWPSLYETFLQASCKYKTNGRRERSSRALSCITTFNMINMEKQNKRKKKLTKNSYK